MVYRYIWPKKNLISDASPIAPGRTTALVVLNPTFFFLFLFKCILERLFLQRSIFPIVRTKWALRAIGRFVSRGILNGDCLKTDRESAKRRIFCTSAYHNGHSTIDERWRFIRSSELYALGLLVWDERLEPSSGI